MQELEASCKNGPVMLQVWATMVSKNDLNPNETDYGLASFRLDLYQGSQTIPLLSLTRPLQYPLTDIPPCPHGSTGFRISRELGYN